LVDNDTLQKMNLRGSKVVKTVEEFSLILPNIR
jgi:hypothetical protein